MRKIKFSVPSNGCLVVTESVKKMVSVLIFPVESNGKIISRKLQAISSLFKKCPKRSVFIREKEGEGVEIFQKQCHHSLFLCKSFQKNDDIPKSIF